MSENNEKKVDMNGEPAGTNGTEDIKGTDFVEPQGKIRKVVKWALGGLALVVTGLLGGVIGHHIGSGSNDDDETEAVSSEEPTTNE